MEQVYGVLVWDTADAPSALSVGGGRWPANYDVSALLHIRQNRAKGGMFLSLAVSSVDQQ